MYNNSLWVKTTNKVPFASAQSENIPENKLAKANPLPIHPNESM